MEQTNQTRREPTATEPSSMRPNYLAAFLLTLFLGLIGVNRLYTGHTLLGWLRCALFVAVFIAPVFYLVDAVTGTIAVILGLVANSAAVLWWYIDLWLYYLGDVRDEATGRPLVKDNPRDSSYAKSMMISLHAAVILGVVLVIVGAGLLISMIQNSPFLQGNPYQDIDTVQLEQQLRDLGL